MSEFTEAIGVDVGEKRIGLARVNAVARLPQPLMTIPMNDDTVQKIAAVVQEYSADMVVVGLPIPASGKDSEQTVFSRQFADTLEAAGMTVKLQDETLSSHRADRVAEHTPDIRNANGEVAGRDELAACVILNDFINSEGQNV